MFKIISLERGFSSSINGYSFFVLQSRVSILTWEDNASACYGWAVADVLPLCHNFTCVLPGKNPGVWQANQKKKVKVMVSCDGVIFSIAFTLCSQCPLQNDKLTQQKSRLLYD